MLAPQGSGEGGQGLEQVRVGVIGMGMGRNHAVYYRDCPEAALVAICDVDANRLAQVAAEVHPWRTYTELDDLLADPEIDAVSIVLPNALHHSVTLRAMEAGKHVMCEKPLAMNAREAEEMVAAARRLGRTLMVHFNSRFHPTAQAVRRAIDEGRLGQVYYARSVWHRQRLIPGLGGWFTRRELSGGGALIDIGIHRLDLALWLMGYPRPVSVTGVTCDLLGKEIAAAEDRHFDVEDLAAAFIRFDTGAALTLETSWASNSEKREDQWTQLFGVEGGALLRNLNEGYEYEARLFRPGNGGVAAEVPPVPEPVETAQQHFCRSILRGEPPAASGEEGLTVMRILDAIYESARSGREVRLDPTS